MIPYLQRTYKIRMDLPRLLERSRSSAFTRWWLNVGLRWMVPFNRPHGFQVFPIRDGGIRVNIPYWRVNRNHIRGIHACCLATAAEYCSGLALLERLGAHRYRLIMKSLNMEYHYQAKARAHAVFAPSEAEVLEQVLVPLESCESVLYVAQVSLHDEAGNHLATGRITWQVKAWERVRTNV